MDLQTSSASSDVSDHMQGSMDAPAPFSKRADLNLFKK